MIEDAVFILDLETKKKTKKNAKTDMCYSGPCCYDTYDCVRMIQV